MVILKIGINMGIVTVMHFHGLIHSFLKNSIFLLRLTYLSIEPLSSSHVVTNGRISFIFIAEPYSTTHTF